MGERRDERGSQKAFRVWSNIFHGWREKIEDLCTRVNKKNKRGCGMIVSLLKKPLTLHRLL